MTLLDAWHDTIADQTARLARAVERGPDRPVAACPGWDVADVAVHVGQGHRYWTQMVRERVATGTSAASLPTADRPADDLAGWLRSGGEEVVALLRSTDPASGVWNWSRGPNVAGWVARRLAHEVAVHRWDAEHAVRGEKVRPITPPEVATDGILELLTMFLGVEEPRYDGPDAWLRIAPDDADRTFDLRLLAPRVHLSDDLEGVPDAVVRGSSSDLLLVLWGRPVEVTVTGERHHLRALRDYLDLD